VEVEEGSERRSLTSLTGTQFTCFTGTKVQILKHSSMPAAAPLAEFLSIFLLVFLSLYVFFFAYLLAEVEESSECRRR
jgi:hypothetical protein